MRLFIAKIAKKEAIRTLFDPNSMRNYARIGNHQSIKKIKLNTGLEMYVDLNDIIGYRTALTGQWDDTALRVIQVFSSKNTLYIDIGANIGLTSIPIAKLGYETIAIEPNPVALNLITRNIALNSPSKFYLFPFALGSSSENVEMIDLFMPQGNLGASSTNANWSPGLESLVQFSVPRISLDKVVSFLFSKSKLAECENLIIKLDVEGQEDSVMEGSENLISEKRPIVIFENNPPNGSQKESVRFWSNWSDYRFFGYKNSKAENFVEQKRYENVIAIPTEKLEILGEKLGWLFNS